MEAEVVAVRMEWKTGVQGRMNRPWPLIVCWGKVGVGKGRVQFEIELGGQEKMIAPERMSSSFSYTAFHVAFSSSTWGAWFKVICRKEM